MYCNIRAGAHRLRRVDRTTESGSASCGRGSVPATRHNPHAWIRNPVTADEIWQPRPQNRIAGPYASAGSNNMVDQGAALLLTSGRTCDTSANTALGLS